MQTRIAAYAVILDSQGRVLLTRWRHGKRWAWTLPGGGIEHGEPPEHAVRREIMEESGYKASVDAILGAHSRVLDKAKRVQVDADDLHQISIVYAAHVTGGRLRSGIVEEGSDCAAWFARTAIPAQRSAIVDVALGWHDATLSALAETMVE